MLHDPIDPNVTVTNVLFIGRLLLLLLMLGLTPVLASEEGCCCGTAEPVCDPTSVPKALTADDIKSLLSVRTSGVDLPTVCGRGTADDSCPCWEAQEAPSKLIVAAFRTDLEHHHELPTPIPVTIKRPTRPSTRAVQPAVPWRAPIPHQPGWSHAQYPLPPPSLVVV